MTPAAARNVTAQSGMNARPRGRGQAPTPASISLPDNTSRARHIRSEPRHPALRVAKLPVRLWPRRVRDHIRRFETQDAHSERLIARKNLP